MAMKLALKACSVSVMDVAELFQTGRSMALPMLAAWSPFSISTMNVPTPMSRGDGPSLR